MTQIAFIGLGNMGGPMAANLIKAGHQLTVFDLSADAVQAAVDLGASAADSVGAAVKSAEVVVSMLPAGKHVEAVYTGADGVMENAPAGTLFIDSSTIDVATARRVAAGAVDKGFAMVDAPVSGGVGGAAAGTLTFMVGGPDEAFAKAKPYLDIMGKNIVQAGGAGNGQAAKICNNMMLGIQMLSVAEAFTLAKKLGLDDQNLFDISSTASGQCWSLTSYCPVPGPVETSPANRDYQPGFAAGMMLKDLKLAQQAAAEAGASTPLGAAAESLYQMFDSQGQGGTDFSGIIRMLDPER